MAPLIIKLKKYTADFVVKVCVTAQHREMLDQVLKIFNIIPDYDLDIMSKNQNLYDITCKVLLGVGTVLEGYQPDIVFVHGDTTTSMATALAAFYQKVKIAHVEAGLRTYNLQSPWPEEMNRQLTDRICDYCFTPTEISRQNLLKENIDEKKIFVTGNTVIDALLMVLEMIDSNNNLREEIIANFDNLGYKFNNRKIILVTGHRRENFGNGFLNICQAIK